MGVISNEYHEGVNFLKWLHLVGPEPSYMHPINKASQSPGLCPPSGPDGHPPPGDERIHWFVGVALAVSLILCLFVALTSWHMLDIKLQS